MYIETQKSLYSTNNKDIKSFLGYPDNYPIEKIANDVIAYFRKSRKDEEQYKNEDTEKTLARHIKTIQEWAINVFGVPIPLKNIKKEVVSGDNIDDRPVIQEVLRSIENPHFRAVICVDVQRLGRGDLEDQGKLIKILQFSNTKVLTPNQWFDLNNKFDKKFFEQKMRESREYLEYVKEIMGNGRIRSVLDATYPHSTAPYGYNRVRIENSKGFTLIYNQEEYDVCKLMINTLKNGLHIQYTVQEHDSITSICKTFGIVKENLLNSNDHIDLQNKNMINIDIDNPGTSIIANYLNFLEIKPRKSFQWTPAMVRNILLSPAAHGFVSWNKRKKIVKLQNGIFIKSRPINKDDVTIVKGRWEPIFSEEEIEIIDNYFSKKQRPIRKDKTIKNPLMGLIKCEICDSKMQRRPYYNNHSINSKNKRTFEIDKNKLRVLLREHKGNLSLSNIAHQLHISKYVVEHWFAADEKKFTIPYAEKWFELKKLLNINTDEFDQAITIFKKNDVPHIDTLICTKHGCTNISSDLILVEKKVIDMLKVILIDYKDYVDNYETKIKQETQTNNETLKIINKNLEMQKKKLDNLCDLLETGIYSKELFIERKNKIDLEIINLEQKKKALSTNNNANKLESIQKMIPLIEKVINDYDINLSPELKNRLLSSIIKVIYYKKEKGGKKFKENFRLKIFLKI